ncbi:STAS domain-containing protein [Nocardioides sp. YIM 152315]|uniref:STAS domain-containing protein n=1 Tax=Nocardioides sp. YIM 152315 TaxID=3031760 RepID=UPI0023DA10F9|nr:STAS domain-containing protein [Nocardioides sp. YIM 152315]MDF1605796.1 STAS domain-containing protein [Nocardioides sp. YIM 152315]
MRSSRTWHRFDAADHRAVERVSVVPTAAAPPVDEVMKEVVVVRLTNAGLVDVLDDLDRRLDVALSSGPRSLVLDMSVIGQVSSTTIAALLWARRRCSSRGVELLLQHPSRRCRAALERIGLLGIAVVESSVGGRIRIPFVRQS